MTNFNLIASLSSWFFRRDREIDTGGKDINTSGGDVIVGAGTVDGVDVGAHDADADAHHAESHTVASHSDTTATGSELNTLTDGSDASTLHDHDGRYFQESEFSSDPGSASSPLESDSNGDLVLQTLTLEAALSLSAEGSIYILSGGVLRIAERASIGTPTSGHMYIYPKTDGRLYYKNDSGTEYGPL